MALRLSCFVARGDHVPSWVGLLAPVRFSSGRPVSLYGRGANASGAMRRVPNGRVGRAERQRGRLRGMSATGP